MKKLEEFFSLYRYLSDGGKKICPVGMLTAEYPTLPEVIKKDIRILLDEEKNWLQDLLKKGKKNNDFKSSINPELMAEIILSSLTNSLNRIRIYKNSELLDNLFKGIKKLL
jgi:hypothetical protein